VRSERNRSSRLTCRPRSGRNGSGTHGTPGGYFRQKTGPVLPTRSMERPREGAAKGPDLIRGEASCEHASGRGRIGGRGTRRQEPSRSEPLRLAVVNQASLEGVARLPQILIGQRCGIVYRSPLGIGSRRRFARDSDLGPGSSRDLVNFSHSSVSSSSGSLIPEKRRSRRHAGYHVPCSVRLWRTEGGDACRTWLLRWME
jgi:hypothetical protein